jgi:uncharacterized Zn-binding protein involved in type VI secretion
VSRALICKGDKTSHGGEVLTGTGTSKSGGRMVARVTDQVSCPNHGTNNIVSGDSTLMIDGQPAARHGDSTACGATLIASQQNTSSG